MQLAVRPCAARSRRRHCIPRRCVWIDDERDVAGRRMIRGPELDTVHREARRPHGVERRADGDATTSAFAPAATRTRRAPAAACCPEHDVLRTRAAAQIEVLDAAADRARGREPAGGRIATDRRRRRRHRPEPRRRCARLRGARSRSRRATPRGIGARLRDDPRVAARPRRDDAGIRRGEEAIERARANRPRHGSGAAPLLPAARPNVPSSVNKRVWPTHRCACRPAATPFAIAARTYAESIATVSMVDVARFAPNAARIVAGSKPRPRANAVAVSDVAGARRRRRSSR